MTNMLDDDERPVPPPNPPSAAPPWRLIRARDGWVGGVSGGLARSAGIDLALVRLAFVFAAPSGLGLLAYLALWVLTPRADGETVADPQPAPPQMASTIKLLLLAGVIVSTGGLWFLDPFPWDDVGGLIGLLLIGVGVVWLVHRRTTERPAPPAPLPPPSSFPPPVRPAPPVPPPVEPADGVDTPATSEPLAAEQPQPVSDVRGGPIDATLGMTPPPVGGGVASGEGAPRGRAADLALSVVMWLGVLATIGAKLVVGAFVLFEVVDLPAAGLFFTASTAALLAMIVAAVKRWSWLFGASAAALVGLVIAGVAVASFNGDVGRRTERVTSLDRLATRYENAVGQMKLDLSSLELAGSTQSIVVKEGIGRADIVVPDDVTVEVDYDVQMGDMLLFRDVRDLWNDSGSHVERGRETAGTLRIDAELGAGTLRVCRAVDADLIDTECPG